MFSLRLLGRFSGFSIFLPLPKNMRVGGLVSDIKLPLGLSKCVAVRTTD